MGQHLKTNSTVSACLGENDLRFPTGEQLMGENFSAEAVIQEIVFPANRL